MRKNPPRQSEGSQDEAERDWDEVLKLEEITQECITNVDVNHVMPLKMSLIS